ncbi:unnamed protein product [Symbiodinium sp. KB8]|nr:unnamed protein product [Symbiodinium sp. KB8]
MSVSNTELRNTRAVVISLEAENAGTPTPDAPPDAVLPFTQPAAARGILQPGEKFDILEFLGSGALGGVFKTSLKGPQHILRMWDAYVMRMLVSDKLVCSAWEVGARLAHGTRAFLAKGPPASVDRAVDLWAFAVTGHFALTAHRGARSFVENRLERLQQAAAFLQRFLVMGFRQELRRIKKIGQRKAALRAVQKAAAMDRLGLSVDVLPWEPGDWPKAFATSPYMSTKALVIYRGIVAVVLIGHALVHFVKWWPQDGVLYWIYLSRWITTLEVIEEILYFVVTLWAAKRLGVNAPSDPVPFMVKVVIALFCALMPASVLSTILYYATQPFPPPGVPYVSLFVHGGDVILLHLTFFLSRFPFSIRKIGWIALVGWTYTVWSLIHFFAKIGRPEREPCEPAPLNECPIYEPLDWRYPLRTSILVALGALVGPPLFGSLYVFLTGARDRCDTGAKELRERQLLEPYQAALEEAIAQKCREIEQQAIEL